MTPNDVKLALHEVLGAAFVVFMFGWLGATALAAGVGSFFGKRGETAAIKHDIEAIKTNLSAMTTVTEQINAEVSGDLWERQNRWTFKKDLYIRLLTGLSDAASAITQLRYLVEHPEGRASERRPTLVTKALEAEHTTARLKA